MHALHYHAIRQNDATATAAALRYIASIKPCKMQLMPNELTTKEITASEAERAMRALDHGRSQDVMRYITDTADLGRVSDPAV